MIFDLTISDQYIRQLNLTDTTELIDEARIYVDEIEGELKEMLAGVFDESIGLQPSQVSWDPWLYRDEIDEKPWLAEVFAKAQEMSSLVGRALAIESTAVMHRATMEDEYEMYLDDGYWKERDGQ